MNACTTMRLVLLVYSTLGFFMSALRKKAPYASNLAWLCELWVTR